MKNFIEKFKDYLYRGRLGKWFSVNIRLALRSFLRVFRGQKLKGALRSTPAAVGLVSAVIIALSGTAVFLFTKYACPYFDTEAGISRRLSLEGADISAPYLSALSALGSSNRIQVTLRTDDENYVSPLGVGLDRGGVNLRLTFSDGQTTEFALKNGNYDNFESGQTDSFTLILPFGYTPFDITSYTIAVLPDRVGRYDSWRCRWVHVYFLLGGQPTMLARESWENCALFGDGDSAVRESQLSAVHGSNAVYKRSEKIYSYYLALTQKGAKTLISPQLKADTLDALGLNGGKSLYLDIETVNIEMQNNILTYYTRGVEIPDTDSLDYDGRMFLDITFLSPKPDGGYIESFELDTLGTDDFEMGTTSSFKLELPEGMCVFDISGISLRTENPHDSWAPHYIRVYIKPDYCDMLEIARLNDTMLINGYSTPVFYKNLIDNTAVAFDLDAKFCISETVKDKIEQSGAFSFGDTMADMYFELQSFYDRQDIFFGRAVDLFSESVYNPEAPETPETPDEEAAPDTDDGVPADEITPGPTPDDESPVQKPAETEPTEPAAPEAPETPEQPTEAPPTEPTEPEGDSSFWQPEQGGGQDREPIHDVWGGGTAEADL